VLPFICVRKKDLTSSVYNIHLARQIFQTNFELGNERIFQQNEQYHFWTDLPRDREECRTSHGPEKPHTFCKKTKQKNPKVGFGFGPQEMRKNHNVFKQG
jgi:hypothetical protein